MSGDRQPAVGLKPDYRGRSDERRSGPATHPRAHRCHRCRPVAPHQRARRVRPAGGGDQGRGRGRCSSIDPNARRRSCGGSRRRNPGPLRGEEVARLFREIMSACLALERPVRAAFLGPEGTFTQAATRKHFGHSVQTVPMATIGDIFSEVEAGSCDYGVVPVENSTEGVISHTLDLFMASPLRIVGEVSLRIHHHLMGKTPDLAAIQDRLFPPAVPGPVPGLAGPAPAPGRAGRRGQQCRGRAAGGGAAGDGGHRREAGGGDLRGAGPGPAHRGREGQHHPLPGDRRPGPAAQRAGQDQPAARLPQRVRRSARAR